MGDTASLTLKVETSSLENATTKLDNFKNKASEVEKATNDLSGAQSGAQKEIDSLNKTIDSIYRSADNYRKKLLATAQETNKTASRSTELYKSYQKQIASIRDLSTYEKEFASVRQLLSKELKTGNLELDKYVSLTQQSATQQKQLITQDLALTAAREKFLKALKEQVIVQNMSKEQLLQYKAAQLGVSSSADIYIKKLTQANSVNGAVTKGFSNSKASIKMMGYQLSSLTSQLVSGQNPLILLTQQGSQIASIFGPIGAMVGAALAVGGAIGASFIPSLFNAKSATDTLREAQESLGKSFTANKEGVIELSDEFESLTKTNIDAAINKLYGLEAKLKKTSDGFKELFSKSLNDDLSKWTNSILSASQADADKLGNQVSKIKQMGISFEQALDSNNLQRKYSEIKGFAVLAQEAQKQYGITKNASIKLLELFANVQNASDTTEAAKNIQSLSIFIRKLNESIDNDKLKELAGSIADIAAQSDIAANQKKLLENILKYSSEDYLTDLRGQRLLSSELDKRITKEQAELKVAQEVNAILAARTNLVNQDKLESTENRTGIKDYTAEEQLIIWEAVSKKYSILSKTQKTNSFSILNDAKQQEISLNSQLKSLKNQELTTKTITSERKKYYDLQAQIKVIESSSEKDKLSAQDKYILANKESLLTQYAKNAAIADEIAQYDSATKALRKMTEYTAQLKADTKASIETFGMTSKESSRYTQLSNLEAQKDIALSFTSNPNDIAKITQEYNTAKAQLEASWTTEDLNQSNWVAGLNSGLNQYAETAQDVFSAANNFAQQSMGSMTNMMTTLVTTGKASFSDFAKSMLTNLVQIINQLLVAQAVQAAMGWMGYSSGGHVNSSAKPAIRRAKSFDSGGFTGSGGKFDPAGIVHKGEFVITKEATQRIGVDNLYALQRAATKGYAGGGLVSGSMPTGTLNNLKSSSQSNQSVIVYSNVTVNNQSSTSSEQSSSQNDAVSKAYQQVVQQGIKTGISKELKQGGLIWQAMQSR